MERGTRAWATEWHRVLATNHRPNLAVLSRHDKNTVGVPATQYTSSAVGATKKGPHLAAAAATAARAACLIKALIDCAACAQKVICTHLLKTISVGTPSITTDVCLHSTGCLSSAPLPWPCMAPADGPPRDNPALAPPSPPPAAAMAEIERKLDVRMCARTHVRRRFKDCEASPPSAQVCSDRHELARLPKHRTAPQTDQVSSEQQQWCCTSSSSACSNNQRTLKRKWTV